MPRVCILTDSSAQFPHHSFQGQDLVRVIPYDVELSGVVYPEGKDVKVTKLPLSADQKLNPKLIPPSEERFTQWFTALGQEFNELLVILQASQLSQAYQNALQAAVSLQGSISLQVINSQTTSAGLGTLVQIAAEAIYCGASASEAEHIIRSQVPHIYSVLCSPGLSYLHFAGIVDQAQAVVGEMLNFLPVYTLEEDRLTPLEKVRNYRNTLDFFIEFLEEFENLRHIALIQSVPPLIQETRTLRQIFQEMYPNTTYSEHNLNSTLAVLFGPRLLGLVIVENVD
jgi:DegV family protein with EDD domain